MYLPGTTIETNQFEARQIFGSLYSAGGLVLSQICNLTGLEAHGVQNWVKRKFVAAPVEKKYSVNRLCRIITINMLKDVLSLDMIASLISHVNGILIDDSDNIIEDSELYFLFVELLKESHGNLEDCEACLRSLLKDFKEPAPGSLKRLKDVLRIMLTAYLSAEYRKQALVFCEKANLLKKEGD